MITEKGNMIVENLFPDNNDHKKLKAAKAELYGVFSKYVKNSDKKINTVFVLRQSSAADSSERS